MMENFIFYIGKSALAASGFYLCYLALFQNRKHFTFNRVYLPVSLVLSLLIPLISFTRIRYIEAAPVAANSLAFLPENLSSPTNTGFRPEWFHYLFGIYILGLSGFIFHLISGCYRAVSIIKKSKLKFVYGLKVQITKKDVHPFSFFNKIVIPEKALDHPNLKMILDHEKIHVKEKHSFDIIFSEVLFILQWFNPFAWLIKDALKNNLEYKTDHQVIKIHNPKEYQLTMVGMADKKGIAPFLTAFDGSQLKNRIIMMKKKTQNKYVVLRQLVILPLLAVLVMGLSNREVKTEIVYSAKEFNISNSKKSINNQSANKSMNASVVKKEFSQVPENPDNLKRDPGLRDRNEELIITQDLVTQNISSNSITANNTTPGKQSGAMKQPDKIQSGGAQSPLIVVDENIFEGERKDINPENIRSVRIIKDSSATSIYGEKGKDGVILVRTKSANNSDRDYKLKSIQELIDQRKPVDPELVIMPEFPGGVNALNEFISGSIQYPSSASEKGIYGRVMVNFIISKTGKVTDVKLSRGVDPALDEEALRVVNSLPDWNPGMQNGEPVEVAYTVPVNFVLPKSAVARKQLNDKPSLTGYTYIVDGRETDNIDNIRSEDILDIVILKGKDATSKYGKKGSNGVIVITTKDNSEKVKINTDNKLRKFIADKIRYPVAAQKGKEEGTVQFFIRTDSKGNIIQLSEKAYGNETFLGEVVVVGYSTERKSRNMPNKKEVITSDESIADLKEALKEEVRRVIHQLPQIEIPEYKDKAVGIKVKFILQ